MCFLGAKRSHTEHLDIQGKYYLKHYDCDDYEIDITAGVSRSSQLGKPRHLQVTKALRTLLHPDLNTLGTALGLSYTLVKNMEHDKLNDMVAAWLRGDDDVVTPPTWATLVEALREIGKNGVADEIEATHNP